MPKSVVLASNDGVIMMFAGLMSRWMTLCSWAYSKRACDLSGDVDGAGERELVLLQERLQGGAFDELHHDEAGVGSKHDVVDGDDVRVLELRRHLGFADKAFVQCFALLGVQ